VHGIRETSRGISTVGLAWAREALRRSELRLATIAIDAGCYDESHFIRAFRRHFGMTPGAYRRGLGFEAARA